MFLRWDVNRDLGDSGPEGLGPDEHLRVALGVQHHVARPVVLKAHIHHALDNQHSNPDDLVSVRRMVTELVLVLGALLRQANGWILNCVHVDSF